MLTLIAIVYSLAKQLDAGEAWGLIIVGFIVDVIIVNL